MQRKCYLKQILAVASHFILPIQGKNPFYLIPKRFSPPQTYPLMLSCDTGKSTIQSQNSWAQLTVELWTILLTFLRLYYLND